MNYELLISLACLTSVWCNSIYNEWITDWMFESKRPIINRFLVKMISCSLCAGFWIGLIGTGSILQAAIISIAAELITKLLKINFI